MQVGSTAWDYTFENRADDRLVSSILSSCGPRIFYDHDALGRRTSRGPGSNPNETRYTYDDASRLTSWSRRADSAAYTYDGNGQRTSATATVGGLTLLSLASARSDEATYSVAYLCDEDGRSRRRRTR